MPSSDLLVLGGGPNGLACALRLAKGGARVTLLEAQPEVGGGARTVEFAPGYRVSHLAHIVQGPDPRLALDLPLSAPLATTALGPDPLTLDPTGQSPGLAPPDAAAWAALLARLSRFATALAPLRRMTPPKLGRGNEVGKLAKVALDLRRLGTTEFREFLRMLLLNAADALEDELADPRLMGLAAFDATLGAWAGPRSPGTLLVWLDRLAQGPLRLPQGGMGAVPAAMARAAQSAGVTIRTNARVASIDVENDRARGVTLASGESLRADAVVSALSPQTTLLHLVDPRHLDTGTTRRARSIPARGASAKLHLALTGAPPFPADLKSRLVIAPTLDAVEEAFNPVKYGEVPSRPVMEITVPTAHDPSLAPPGHHVLSAIVQFAPHAPADRDAARAAMLENALRVLEEHAPGLRALIAQAELLMPYDIETKYGLPGGSWHHGDLAPERMLFLRPFPEAAHYQSPLPGLWLASAGSHPGGGVTGTAGLNAAERLLKDGP